MIHQLLWRALSQKTYHSIRSVREPFRYFKMGIISAKSIPLMFQVTCPCLSLSWELWPKMCRLYWGHGLSTWVLVFISRNWTHILSTYSTMVLCFWPSTTLLYHIQHCPSVWTLTVIFKPKHSFIFKEYLWKCCLNRKMLCKYIMSLFFAAYLHTVKIIFIWFKHSLH